MVRHVVDAGGERRLCVPTPSRRAHPQASTPGWTVEIGRVCGHGVWPCCLKAAPATAAASSAPSRTAQPAVGGGADREAQAVRVLVDVLQRRRLGAEETPAQRVLLSPADGEGSPASTSSVSPHIASHSGTGAAVDRHRPWGRLLRWHVLGDAVAERPVLAADLDKTHHQLIRRNSGLLHQLGHPGGRAPASVPSSGPDSASPAPAPGPGGGCRGSWGRRSCAWRVGGEDLEAVIRRDGDGFHEGAVDGPGDAGAKLGRTGGGDVDALKGHGAPRRNAGSGPVQHPLGQRPALSRARRGPGVRPSMRCRTAAYRLRPARVPPPGGQARPSKGANLWRKRTLQRPSTEGLVRLVFKSTTLVWWKLSNSHGEKGE